MGIIDNFTCLLTGHKRQGKICLRCGSKFGLPEFLNPPPPPKKN